MRDQRAQYYKDLAAGKKDLFDISSGKELVVALLIMGGAISLMQFAPFMLAAAIPLARAWKDTPTNKRRFSNTFSRLKKGGHLEVESRQGQVSISLTKKGRRSAQQGYARALLVGPQTAKGWDKKWRLILFDVPASESVKRNAFRALIKRLGAIMLQKSVWIYPHDCTDEITLLKNFFELDEDHVRLVVADSIGSDVVLKKRFKL